MARRPNSLAAMFRLDPADPDQARALERLSNDTVVWLTTVSPKLRPQPSAVWFLWDGETVLVYSGSTARIKNIAANPQVALNFNSDEHGDDISILYGEAIIDEATPPAQQVAEYRVRYDERVPAIGMDWDGFCDHYRFPIRISLTGYRRW
jgi:PPOX class probable F420-dependent enzyme